MKAIIPAKLSERLPGKHLLPFKDSTVIEEVYRKASRVFETLVYSKVELPVPFIRDDSKNIMELVYGLRKKYGAFALVGGDMVFFTEDDLKLLKSSFSGKPVVPRGEDGSIEPMFSIYTGDGNLTRNLKEALLFPETVFIPKNRFSKYAFFNINTKQDYEEAKRIQEASENLLE